MDTDSQAVKRIHDEEPDPNPSKRVKGKPEPLSTADPEIVGGVGAKSPTGLVDIPDPQPEQPEKGGTGGKKNKNISRRRDAAGYPKSRKGKEKDEKNAGRRARRGTRNEESQNGENSVTRTAGSQAADGEEASKAPRLPKRQCALLIGFCGTGCSGMQIQPNTRTIEGVLFDAMVRAGAVSQDNADDPVKVNLGRAARTDAGVHAAGNVVSIKMITTIPGVPDIVSRINEELPPEIRLWGYVRVQNSFNARLSCDSRKYTYFFPTYLLIPPKPGTGLERALQQQAASFSPVLSKPRYSIDPFWAEVGGESSSPEDDLLRKRSWRISTEQLGRLREAAQKFEGTHNFHNFTVGRDFSDRSNQRHMKKIEIADPQVYGETEWISVLFHGQSFMLHQIRKMMSALILSCRTGTPHQVIDELYGPRTVFVPKMPSLGLLLEHPIFDSYNAKVAGINEKLQPSDPEYRPSIDFGLYQDKIAEFKQKHIYENMRAIEDRDGLFDAWVRSIDTYGGNDMLYLNPKGTVPAAAVIKKGERRENPFREIKRFDTTNFPGDDANTVALEDEEEDTRMDKARLVDTEG